MTARSVHDVDAELLGLSTLLGRSVQTADGRRLGKVIDVAATLSEPHPTMELIGVGSRGHVQYSIALGDIDGDIASLDNRRDLHMRAACDPVVVTEPWAHAKLRLDLDVLDCQVIDLAGRRVARVCEVLVARVDDGYFVVGVEVGAAGVLRRLGLVRLSQRIAREVVDWDDLTLTARRARTLQFSGSTSKVQRLEPAQLATVLAHIPIEHAIEMLHVAEPVTAAEALAATHTNFGTRLLHALPHHSAATFVGHMAPDNAASLLRNLPTRDLDAVLASVDAERAAVLRQLVQHDADAENDAENDAESDARQELLARRKPGRSRYAGVRRSRGRAPGLPTRADRSTRAEQ